MPGCGVRQEARRLEIQEATNGTTASEEVNAGDGEVSGKQKPTKSWSLEDESDEDGDGNDGDGEEDEEEEAEEDREGGDDGDDFAEPLPDDLVPPPAPRGREEVDDEDHDNDHDHEGGQSETVGAADAGEGDEDGEEDPLEAFMSSLDGAGEVVPQESLNALPSAVAPAPRKVNPFGSNTISLEEILGQRRVGDAGDGGVVGEGWESDAPSESEDGDADDEALEREREEFMRAIRSLHGGQPSGVSTPGARARRDGDVVEHETVSSGQADRASEQDSAAKSGPQGEGKSDADLGADVDADPAAAIGGGKPTEDGKGQKSKGKTGKSAQELGRMFAGEGDVMEEHEREVRKCPSRHFVVHLLVVVIFSYS